MRLLRLFLRVAVAAGLTGYLLWKSHPSDVARAMLISVSSSGRSPNVVRALECARSMSLTIVTLSGRDADNPSRGLGDLNFYIPHQRYGWIECAHQLILHYWLDQFMNTYGHGAA